VPHKTPPKVGLGRLLREASAAFNRVFKARLAPLRITYGQFQYLQGLWESDGLTQTDLTRRVGVEMAASTPILDSLEKRKLIKRARNVSDRRKIHVYLTAAGAALKEKLSACVIDANQVARQNVSNVDLAALFDVLGQITVNLRNAPMLGTNEVEQPRLARAVAQRAQRRYLNLKGASR
jgi:MarR family transcriptional regulator, organic hydroperoxide resistance regulator